MTAAINTVKIQLPAHLRTLAESASGQGSIPSGELTLAVESPVTQRTILDALEALYPMLRGTIRDHATGLRRPFLRFFACESDLSHQPPDTPVPQAVAEGKEVFIILGAIAGG